MSVSPLEPEEEEEDDEAMQQAALSPLEEDEDEMDDATMLAAIMTPEIEEKQHHDDHRLPAAAATATPQPEEVDYLEGITAEMFGRDDDFNCWDASIEEEDWSEPLPDAHYGLLPATRELQRPQGSVDLLPEEVLREVLSLLPAQDLYRSAIRVCHRWRNIIQDSKVRQLSGI